MENSRYREFINPGSPIDGNRVYYSGTYAEQSEDQIDMELRLARTLDYDFLKTYVRLSDRLQKKVTKVAHEIRIPITSHELYPATAYGVDGVEHILVTSRRGYSPKMSHTYQSYDDVIQLIAQSQIAFTPTLSIYLGYDYVLFKNPKLLDDKRIQYFLDDRYVSRMKLRIEEVSRDSTSSEVRFSNASKMIVKVHDQGGIIVAGTDSPIVPYGLGLHIEMEGYQRAGLTPAQVLKTATINGAEALHTENDMGSIEVGKLADMIILETNPLEDIRNARQIIFVIIGDKIISIDSLMKTPQF